MAYIPQCLARNVVRGLLAQLVTEHAFVLRPGILAKAVGPGERIATHNALDMLTRTGFERQGIAKAIFLHRAPAAVVNARCVMGDQAVSPHMLQDQLASLKSDRKCHWLTVSQTTYIAAAIYQA